MSRALIRWISGPVLHARAEGPFALREAVRVGPQGLLGEVVRLDGDTIVVQVYEDTTGLRPGVEVTGDGQPLTIPLGPGLLGNIFDGLLRPLSGLDTAHVAPGLRRASAAHFEFEPLVGVVKRRIEAQGFDVELVASEGSAQNLARLQAEEPRVDVAIVQGGVADVAAESLSI